MLAREREQRHAEEERRREVGKVFLLSDGAFAFTPRGFTAILDLEEIVAASGPNVLPTLGGISQGLKELLVRYA